jgi:hypothetical protein
MTAPAIPMCPRCGYDQAGAIAWWERSDPPACPLNGVCSECGLGFAWRDVLNPRFGEDGLFYETANRRLAHAFVVTMARPLRPRRFWSWVRMEHQVEPVRLVLAAAAAAAAVCLGTRGLLWSCGWLVDNTDGWLLTRWQGMHGWSDRRALESFLDWPPYRARFRRWALQPWLGVAFIAVLAMPFAFVFLPETLRRARVRPRHLLRIWMYGFVSLPLAFGAPAFLATLAALATYADVKFHGAGFWLEGLGVGIVRRQWVLGLGCIGVWMMVWWTAAAGRYLRLPRPAVVAGAMTVLAMLLAAAAIAAIPGGLAWMVADQ